MNLGTASDWALVVGLLVSATTLIVAVWRLARAAAKLETSVDLLSTSQRELARQLAQHAETFRAHERDTAKAIADLQAAVNRLTWEVQRLKGMP